MRNRKKPVMLPIETKSREFHGKLFLALHLLAKGHPVLIGEQAGLWEYGDLIEPAICVDKSIASTHADWIRRCRAMGHDVVSWDEEGLIFFDSWMYRKLRVEPKSFEGLSRFFAWGEVQREAICEQYPQYREKIALCGNPRFDLLRPGLREFYRDEVDTLKRRFGKMLLVNTNFALHNHYKTPEQVRQALANYPLAGEPGYIDGWIAMQRHAHEAYLAMVPELLARYPEHTVVVRPHPSENHGPWRDLAKQHARLHVDSSGNVHEWILASEAIIHFNCTTAVEAFLLDVPAIAYRPGRYPRYENPLPYALSENTFSLDELWAALEGRFTARARGVLWTEEQWATAERYLVGITGPTSSEIISAEIRQMGAAETSTSRRPVRLVAHAKRTWRLGLHAWRRMRRPHNGYATQKFPGIKQEEIEKLLSKMMTAANLSVQYRTKWLATNCIWILPA